MIEARDGARRAGGGLGARRLALRRRAVHPARPPRPGVGLPRARGSTSPSASRLRGSRTSTRSRRPTATVVRFHADLEQTADGIERTLARQRPALSRASSPAVARIYERLRPLLTSPPPGPARRCCGPEPGGTCRSCCARWAPSWPAPGLPAAGGRRPGHLDARRRPDDGRGAQPAGVRPGADPRRRRLLSRAAASARSRRPWPRRPSTAGVEFRYGHDGRRDPLSRAARPGASRPDRARSSPPTRSSPTAAASAPTWSCADADPAARASRLKPLPLQSPGVCAYLAVRGGARPPYLRFRLPGRGRAVPAAGRARRSWRRNWSATAGRRPA